MLKASIEKPDNLEISLGAKIKNKRPKQDSQNLIRSTVFEGVLSFNIACTLINIIDLFNVEAH
jgi:hypothetical protein